MTTEAPARRASRYTEDTIERALCEVAFCGGNTRQASDHLAKEGVRVPFQTLHKWMTTKHADRYQAAREQISERLAQQNEQLARQYAEAEQKLLERLANETDTLTTKELPAAIKNLGIGRGISISRAIDLRGGNPIRINVQLTADEALRQLASLAPDVVHYDTDTTAQELPDTNPPPPPPLAAVTDADVVNARVQLEAGAPA